MVFLGLARGSAYLDYPVYMLLFLGKAKNLQSYLQTTVFAMYIDLSDHRLHTIGGTVVGFEVFWHSFWHLLRWSTRGDDIRFLWETSTGRTGLLSLCLTPLIVWPALLPSLKRRMSYELRKGFHYLAAVWGVSICFHAPATHILKLMGVPVAIYAADYVYGLLAKTHLIRSTHFRRLETCSAMSFTNPPGFKLDGPGYVYLCLPWINKHQWHAFSAFPHVDQPDKTSLWIAAAGDWTAKLHATISRPTCRPAWVAGPFASPYGRAIAMDNILAVASGIGITPALSLLRLHADTRCVNLIWMCRDASLVEFYVENAEFDKGAWTLIYYTGKRALRIGDLPPSVLVFKSRPKLEQVVRSVVYDIEDNVGLDAGNDAIEATSYERRAQIAIKEVLATYSHAEIFESAANHTKWGRPKPPQRRASSPDASLQASPNSHRRLSEPRPPKQKTSCSSVPSIRRMRSSNSTASGLKSASADGVCRAILEMCGEGAPPEDYVLGMMGGDPGRMMLYDDFELAMDTAMRGGDPDAVRLTFEGGVDDPASARQSKRQVSRQQTLLEASMGPDCRADDPCSAQESEGLAVAECTTPPPPTVTLPSDRFRDEICANWQALYCGGAQPIVDELSRITSKLGMPFSIEKFDW